MMLMVSVLLALCPLAGIALVVSGGGIATVDGIFMSLILLTVSGIFFLNAVLELKKNSPKAPPAQKSRS